MKTIETKELRDKSVKELETMLEKERAALYDMRRKSAMRDLKDTRSLTVQRHNIARILTIITEKQKEIS